MGRISNFVLDTSVESSDKLLGSNSGGATKNFAILDISTFLKNTNAAGASGQIVYSFESNATDYYDISLTAISGNGSLVDEQFYSIILYAGAASGDKTFTHTQTASSTSWTVNHPLNKKPSVTITTLATGVQIIGEVSYTNNNTLVVSFAAAVSGIAHLN